MKYCSPTCCGAHQAATGNTVNGRAPSAVGDTFCKPGGYVYEKAPDGKWYAQHRLVIERRLGRRLTRSEQVHHRDGNKANNADSNLELWLRQHPSGIRLDQGTGMLPMQHD
jgi:hypothetical protein